MSRSASISLRMSSGSRCTVPPGIVVVLTGAAYAGCDDRS